MATGESDFDLGGVDVAGTYQQELEPGIGRHLQEQLPESRPDPQPQTHAPQSQPAVPPCPQSPDIRGGSPFFDPSADIDHVVSHISAGDIGRWISGLDEDHTSPAELAPSASGGTPPPPLPAQTLDAPLPAAHERDKPAPGNGSRTFGPHELGGLLTPEELEALLGKDK
jgi:hypothetical protein